MIDDLPIYGPREYSIDLACDRLRDVAAIPGTSRFKILLWTNEKGFYMEKRGWGEQEVEYGYYRREEDFLNEILQKGNRWRHERAVNPDQLMDHLKKERFDAVVILGSSPALLVRKAVFYQKYPFGPKTVLLEFEKKAWESTDPFSIWHYLELNGQQHLMHNFVHLVARKGQRKFLPVAYDRKIDWNINIADIPASKLAPAHIEQLFSLRTEEGQRLDYKRAAAVAEGKHVDRLIDRICGMANTAGGSIVIGIAESDGSPQLPISTGLENVAKPDSAIMRIQQKLFAKFGADRPDVEFRTLNVKGSNVIVLQIAQSLAKSHGRREFLDGPKLPVRNGRCLDWIAVQTN